VQLKSSLVDLAPLVLEITQALADGAKAIRGWTMDPKFMAELRLAAGYVGAVAKGGAIGGARFARDHAQDIVQIAQTPDNVDWSKFASPDRTFATNKPGQGTSLKPVGGGGAKGPRDRSADALADVELKELTPAWR
jgi:hypothetical protein